MEDSLQAIDHDFALAIRSLVDGGKFDLTDSPKSFIATVERLSKKRDDRIDAVILRR